jgi:hypothetical protein
MAEGKTNCQPIPGRRYEVGFGATDVKALESAMAERFFATFKPLG